MEDKVKCQGYDRRIGKCNNVATKMFKYDTITLHFCNDCIVAIENKVNNFIKNSFND